MQLCLIFTLDFIYQRHHHRLKLRNFYFLQLPYLQGYADAVAGKGVPLLVLNLLVRQLLVFKDRF